MTNPYELVQEADGPALLRLRHWERQYPFVTAGFTTRIGGREEGQETPLNCALHIGDDPERVVRNRRSIARALNVPFEAWTCGEQVHGRRVTVVTGAERGKGRERREDALTDTDALVTNEPGVWLASFYADCVPIYMLDPARRAVGLAHAGWKGTVEQIAAETVRAMQDAYGTEPGELLAVIGPSIGACCYEVDDRVNDRLEACLNEIGADAAARADVRKPVGAPGKWLVNLQEMNRQIMIKAGILPTRIEICGMCTGCRSDLFFSHRREKGQAGRMASWIGLELTGKRERIGAAWTWSSGVKK